MGCKRLAQRVLRIDAGAGTSSGSGAGSVAGSNNDGDDVGEKLHGFIECYNAIDGDVAKSMSRYRSWLDDPEKGPTGKERNVTSPLSISQSDIDTCKKSIPASTKLKPAMPQLEKAGIDYLAAIEDLAPKINDATKYYDRRDYQDDKFAKAIAMHGPIMAAYKKFAKVSDEFSDAIENQNTTYLESQLKKIEADEGQSLKWHKMVLVRDAKEVLHVIERETFDAAKVEALVAKFTEHVDATIAYAAAHKDEQPTSWSLYESRAKSVVDAYKDRMRRVRDKRAYNTGEKSMAANGHPELVSGSAAKCGKAYNELVDTGNSLRFKEKKR
jgi:Spy/CpxP family protein refolding chaperone